MDHQKIYLDHNATTPVDLKVFDYASKIINEWGNPSSIYSLSRQPKKILRETRKSCANFLNVNPLELIFTSGGSESNNLALKGLLKLFKKETKDTIIVSSVEHPSVLKTSLYLESIGMRVLRIPVSREGELDQDFLKTALIKNKVGLVSVMAANNETGVIHPISTISEEVHRNGALLHSDTVQLIGKTHFNFQDLEVDLASFSSHKFYSLKGSGLLFSRKGLQLESLIHGGGQERSRRAGTENTLAIGCMQVMIENMVELEGHIDGTRALRDKFETKLLEMFTGIEITGRGQERLSNTSHLVVKGVDGENLLMNLDLKGFEVSTGAACSAGSPEPSPALLAMGYTQAEAQSSLRLSFGKGNTEGDANKLLDVLSEVIPHLRQIKSQI